MSAALVGVVIPARDGERHLAEAIDSVLAQTHGALDVVVVDDGSCDATREVARRYAPDVRLLAEPHRGLGATRNAGVRAVRGGHVAFLDQDDVWPANKIELQLERFLHSPAPDLVFGQVREFVSPELDRRATERLRCVSAPRAAALPGTMLASRAALQRVGPFPTRWISNDFMAWLMAARGLGLREEAVAEPVLWRRIHASNFSHRADVTRGEYVRVIKESLDRRRAAAG